MICWRTIGVTFSTFLFLFCFVGLAFAGYKSMPTTGSVNLEIYKMEPDASAAIEVTIHNETFYLDLLMARGRKKFRYEDPHLEADAVMASGWLDSGGQLAWNESFKGELFFIQPAVAGGHADEVALAGWLQGLEPSRTYKLVIHEYGDLGDNDNSSCSSAAFGDAYELTNRSDDGQRQRCSASLCHFEVTFTANQTGMMEWKRGDETTKLAPLLGRDSVVGRMLVLWSHDDEDSLRHQVEKYTHEATSGPIGCGPIGIASNFSVMDNISHENLAASTQPRLLSIILLLTVLLAITWSPCG